MNFSKSIYYLLFTLLLAFSMSIVAPSSLQAQIEIKAPKGYSPQVGNLVSMMDDLKIRITNKVQNLSQEEVDFLLDEDANRIGALIYHLAATEKYYQLYTFEGRDFNEEEMDWDLAQKLGPIARKNLQGQPIEYYLAIWDKVRKETKRLLKTKDDKWLAKKVSQGNMNNHWAWYHVMEHQANHMGQIAMIAKRIK